MYIDASYTMLWKYYPLLTKMRDLTYNFCCIAAGKPLFGINNKIRVKKRLLRSEEYPIFQRH